MQLSTGAKQYLLDNGYDAHNGVRPMRRLLQDTVEDHLAVELLENRVNRGDILQVGYRNKELVYTITGENSTAIAPQSQCHAYDSIGFEAENHHAR